MLESIKSYLTKNYTLWGTILAMLLALGALLKISDVGRYAKMIEDANNATVGPDSTLSKIKETTGSLTSQMTDFKA